MTLDDQNNRVSEQRTQQGAASSSVDYGVNALDQYVSISEDGVSLPSSDFDWIGQKTFDATRNLTLHWDGWGRLSSVDNLAGQQIVAYRYDSQNRRVEKRLNGQYATGGETHLHFLYSGSSLIEERAIDLSGGSLQSRVLARYGYAEDGQLLWMDRDVARDSLGAPNPWSGVTDGVVESRVYVHQDSRGNTFALTSASGVSAETQVLEHATYEPYGKTATWSGAWNPSVASYAGQSERLSLYGLPILFGGMYLDTETDLYYAQNRYYDPTEGRFVSRDPIGLAGGANLYAYGDAAPHQSIDPEGLRARPMWPKPAAKAERAWAKATGNPDPFSFLVNEQEIQIGGTDHEESGLGLGGEGESSPEDGYLDQALAELDAICGECPDGGVEVRTFSYFSPGNYDVTCKCEVTTASGIQDFNLREQPEVGLTGAIIDSPMAGPQEFDIDKAMEVFKTAVTIGSFLPGVGSAFSVIEAGVHLIEGNPTQAAYAAMGLIPGLKIATKLFRPVAGAAKLISRRMGRPTGSRLKTLRSSMRELRFRHFPPPLKPLKSFMDRVGKRRDHILNSHRHGANKKGKTEFPPNWSDDRIINNASEVAFDSRSRSYMGPYNSPVREGVRDGVLVRVVFFPIDHARAGHYFVCVSDLLASRVETECDPKCLYFENSKNLWFRHVRTASRCSEEARPSRTTSLATSRTIVEIWSRPKARQMSMRCSCAVNPSLPLRD